MLSYLVEGFEFEGEVVVGPPAEPRRNVYTLEEDTRFDLPSEIKSQD